MPRPLDSLHSLPLPDPQALAHSARLTEHIRAEIAAQEGSVSFRRFMELALYAPGLGYYRAGTHKLGPGGDFVTAPELSPLFSRCLARQCRQVRERVGGVILELGAGSGVMAADLLRELETLDALPDRYAILELSGELRERQRQALEQRVPHLLDRIHWTDTLPRPPIRGVMLANEVLDAMPVERFRITSEGPRPLHVSWEQEGFVWRLGPQDPAVSRTVAALQAQLGMALPTGYTSEFNPYLNAWLAALSESLEAGALVLIDYGYPRREYYHPQRGDGTLLCHYRHRVHADPLILAGLQDITASVDFTAVAEAATAAGLSVAGYTSQRYFLFGCGLEALLAEADPADTARYLRLTQQVKRLTLPAEMGERFKAIALSRGMDSPLQGFTFFDERRRL